MSVTRDPTQSEPPVARFLFPAPGNRPSSNQARTRDGLGVAHLDRREVLSLEAGRLLEAARQEFRASVGGVSDAPAQFTRAVGEGEDAWGIAEVLRHIATIEPIMAERVRLLGTGESVEHLARTHPGYLSSVDTRRIGELNCRSWVALHTLHLQDHARQIASIKRLDGYPAD